MSSREKRTEGKTKEEQFSQNKRTYEKQFQAECISTDWQEQT
jgi:hypothetical protein